MVERARASRESDASGHDQEKTDRRESMAPNRLPLLLGALLAWCAPFGFACGIPLVLAGATVLFFF